MRRLDGIYETHNQKYLTLTKYGISPRNMQNVEFNVMANKSMKIQEVKGIISRYKSETQKGHLLVIGLYGVFEMNRKEYLNFMYR